MEVGKVTSYQHGMRSAVLPGSWKGLLKLKQPKSVETEQHDATGISEIQKSIAVHQFALLTRTCCRTLPITKKQPPHNSVASCRSDVVQYKGNECRHWPRVVSVQLFHLVSFRRTDQLTYGAQGLCVGRGNGLNHSLSDTSLLGHRQDGQPQMHAMNRSNRMAD
jgi:hypothetical protein